VSQDRSPLHLLVFGGRDHEPTPLEHKAVFNWMHGRDFHLVIHGGARGADAWMSDIASSLGIKVREFPADWKKYNFGAGPRRNQEMADFLKDKRAVALMAPGGRGTADMKSKLPEHVPIVELHRLVDIQQRMEENGF